MSRPQDDSPDSQKIKYDFHKRANGTLKHYIDAGNYIGAYVIAFSLLEDRIRAMYIVVKRNSGIELSPDEINGSIVAMARYFKDEGLLTSDVYNPLFEVIGKRNKLLHDAMWKLDVFNEEEVESVQKARDGIRKEFDRYKKIYKIFTEDEE